MKPEEVSEETEEGNVAPPARWLSRGCPARRVRGQDGPSAGSGQAPGTDGRMPALRCPGPILGWPRRNFLVLPGLARGRRFLGSAGDRQSREKALVNWAAPAIFGKSYLDGRILRRRFATGNSQSARYGASVGYGRPIRTGRRGASSRGYGRRDM